MGLLVPSLFTRQFSPPNFLVAMDGAPCMNVPSRVAHPKEGPMSISTATIFPGACHKCCQVPREGERLSSCTRCKYAVYCSRLCQKNAWGAHKAVCASLSKVQKDVPQLFEEVQHKTLAEVVLHRKAVLALVTRAMKRPLDILERHLVASQRYCYSCFRINVPLSTCEGCASISYCKDHDPPEHLCSDFAQVVICSRITYLQSRPTFTEMKLVHSEYKPLPRPLGWETLFPLYYPHTVLDERNIMDRHIGWMQSDIVSFTFTILMALEHFVGTDALPSTTSLNLHLIGGEVYPEFLPYNKYECLFHLLPSLRRLQITMVGPNAKLCGEDTVDFSKNVCSSCLAKGVRHSWSTSTMLYHDWWASSGPGGSSSCDRPDLCVAFNSGLYEHANDPSADTWGGTLALLAAQHLPVCFTSYNNMEGEKDEALARRAGMEVSMPLAPNPFASLHLMPDQEPEEPKAGVEETYLEKRKRLFFVRNAYAFCCGSPATSSSS